MDKQAFLDLIKQPHRLSQKDMEGLDEVIANFPYCQAAHILLAKGANEQGKMLADQKIKKAAAYTLERKNLKQLILSKAPEVKKEEVKEDIPVIHKKELPTHVITAKEDKTHVSIAPQKETFYDELQKNLKELQEIKTKATGSVSANETLKENKPSDLMADKIKEHSKEIHLFSSRLDEVTEDIKSGEISQAELLLNYLTYLKNNKTSAVIDKKKTEEIIEKFIKEEPSIPSLNSVPIPEVQVDKASESYKLRTNAASETLANIMVLQKKYEKAIEIYQELILKYPEKRAYFAFQIEKIKGKIQ